MTLTLPSLCREGTGMSPLRLIVGGSDQNEGALLNLPLPRSSPPPVAGGGQGGGMGAWQSPQGGEVGCPAQRRIAFDTSCSRRNFFISSIICDENLSRSTCACTIEPATWL
jgi:hypothetical protein